MPSSYYYTEVLLIHVFPTNSPDTLYIMCSFVCSPLCFKTALLDSATLEGAVAEGSESLEVLLDSDGGGCLCGRRLNFFAIAGGSGGLDVVLLFFEPAEDLVLGACEDGVDGNEDEEGDEALDEHEKNVVALQALKEGLRLRLGRVAGLQGFSGEGGDFVQKLRGRQRHSSVLVGGLRGGELGHDRVDLTPGDIMYRVNTTIY